MTGLANGDGLQIAAEEALAGRDLGQGEVAVLLLDLDRFKDVNDTLGHATGDELLQAVGSRLQETVDDAAHVSRFGGDEFVVLMTAVPDRATVTELGQRLLTALRAPFEVQGLPVEIDASIGVAVTTSPGEALGTLLQQADVAMYRAKAARCGLEMFSPAMSVLDPTRLAMSGDLRRAVAPDCHPSQLVPHYQPKVCLRTGRVTGVETLIRWQHAELGPSSAGARLLAC